MVVKSIQMKVEAKPRRVNRLNQGPKSIVTTLSSNANIAKRINIDQIDQLLTATALCFRGDFAKNLAMAAFRLIDWPKKFRANRRVCYLLA